MISSVFFRTANFCFNYHIVQSNFRKKNIKIFSRLYFFVKFRSVFAFFYSLVFAKKCRISRKSLRNTNENVCIFRETFRSLETLLISEQKVFKFQLTERRYIFKYLCKTLPL